MVSTGDILKDKIAAEAAEAALADDRKLDDVMLAMDVVDTLRHERIMVEKELAGEDRREALIARLKEIYHAQGIEVPDDVLMDGVLALEEQRFVFEPAKKSVSTSLAKFYVNRRKWLPLFYTFAFVLGSASAINYFGFERPQKVETKRVATLLQKTLPERITESRDRALGLAAADEVKERIRTITALAEVAVADEDPGTAQEYLKELDFMAKDLAQAYDVRIVSRAGEYSGVFRINEDGGQQVRNHYLIVEAILPTGKRAEVMINSEEDQKQERTKIWGVRVPEQVFNRVAADKKDDQIIQNAIIGQKKMGYLDPEFTVETGGGYILDW